jgi:hypothetical protein
MGPALKLFSPFPTHTSPCEREELRKGAVEKKARPCLDPWINFFHCLFITSIFARIHETLIIDKK